MKYVLLKMFSIFWDLETLPRDWNRRGIISAIFKDGDKRDPLNYRGITLLSVVGKTFTSILNERIMLWTEEKGVLEDEQGGFRKGRGCVEQIFILKEVLNLRKGKKTYCCFIDIKKAYDRVWRGGLWKRLWDSGVRGRIWRVLRNLYEDVQSCCKVGAGRTDWFDVDVGVRQGCGLSPVLFNIFINGLGVAIKDLGLGVKIDDGNKLSLLLYADDICVIANSKNELQRMMDAVSLYTRRWRFEINMKKTKVVVFGRKTVI